MKSKMVCISSLFPATTDEIWDKLQQFETLQYIASPYAKFYPIGNTAILWTVGQTLRYHLKVFGFIPLGVHTINVIQFDRDALSVYTNEGNTSVPVWNHRIVLQKTAANDVSSYTDEVEVDAGWKTPVVVLWSNLFYRHRQKKWRKLLRDMRQ
jgi:hypothetical protein